MIIDIRGTHGAGKSWCAWGLIERYKTQPIIKHLNLVGVELVGLDTRIVGPYRGEDKNCGGTDQMHGVSASTVGDLVYEWSENYHVLFEGIITSHTFERYRKLIERIKERDGTDDYHLLFLDTPEEQCVRHVQERRQRRGEEPEFNETNLRHDFRQIGNVREKFKAQGYNVVDVEYMKSVSVVEAMLLEASGR